MLISTKNKIYKIIILFIALFFMILAFHLNKDYFLLHPYKLVFSSICFMCSYSLIYFYYDVIFDRKDCKNEK